MKTLAFRQWASRTVVSTWQMLTPVFVCGLAYTMKTIGDHETSSTANNVSDVIAAILIIWALDLAYARGRAAADNAWGEKFSTFLSGDHTAEMVVRHEHYATPTARAVMAEQGIIKEPTT